MKYKFTKTKFGTYKEETSLNTKKLAGEGRTTVPLYFNFKFFGKVFSIVYVGANGILSFIDPPVGAGDTYYPEFSKDKMAWPQRFDYSIMPWFGDLDPTPG